MIDEMLSLYCVKTYNLPLILSQFDYGFEFCNENISLTSNVILINNNYKFHLIC